MKTKIIARGIIALVIAITIIILVVAVTSSWYAGTLEYGHQFVIEADGVLYIYIPATTEDSGKSLTPAVALPHAVSNGLNIDVLKEYDENDTQPSYVQKAAQIERYSTNFIFYNEYTRPVQAVDPTTGQPLFDELGNPIYVQMIDSETGQPMFDDYDNPIYEKEPVPANITYNIRLKDSPIQDEGEYIDIDELGIKELYFSYDPLPIGEGLPINEENGAIPYTQVNYEKTYGVVRIEGTKEIYIHMQLYLTSVDELMNPLFREKDIYIELELAVQLEATQL